MHPDVDKQKCNSCGSCALQCPTGAIDMQNTKLNFSLRYINADYQ